LMCKLQLRRMRRGRRRLQIWRRINRRRIIIVGVGRVRW